MKINQTIYNSSGAEIASTQQHQQGKPNWTLIFGHRALLENTEFFRNILSKHPSELYGGCSTSGEIYGNNVSDDCMVVTDVYFEKTKIVCHEMAMDSGQDSYEAGIKLMSQLDSVDLAHVFVLSDGLKVNGSELVRGLRSKCPVGLNITGGLAGDGADFQKTVVINGKGEVKNGILSVIAFYSKDLKVGFGSFGGWEHFGIERKVTRSEANVLYELDGSPALELYKSYLGEMAAQLPASGLLFPLSLKYAEEQVPVVRTILAVDEAKQSLTFAGDIPQGSTVRLMKANVDKLADGAVQAASSIQPLLKSNHSELSILISCVGRKLVMKQMVEDEIEGVRSVLGDKPVFTGFYSYGEISPFSENSVCELHNQTMTITTFSE